MPNLLKACEIFAQITDLSFAEISAQIKKGNQVRRKVVITPQTAEQILSLNTDNRPIKTTYVLRLAEQMAKGYWSYTMDAIRISQEGILLDGQHRLHACIKSQKEFVTDLAIGLEKGIFTKIDTGFTRHSSDVFSLAFSKDQKYLKETLALCKFLLNIRLGKNNLAMQDRGSNLAKGAVRGWVLSNEDIINFAKENMHLFEFSAAFRKLMYGSQLPKHTITPNLMLFLRAYLILEQRQPQSVVDKFILELSQNSSITNRATNTFHDKLVLFLVDNRDTKVRLSYTELFYALVKAWNLFVKKGKRSNRLSISDIPQAMPDVEDISTKRQINF